MPAGSGAAQLLRRSGFSCFASSSSSACRDSWFRRLPIPAGPASARNFWDTKERLPKPDIPELPRIRFLTVNFPPFNFLNSSGRLTGFHVDLARAICRELEIVDKCREVQALPWAELQDALQGRRGDHHRHRRHRGNPVEVRFLAAIPAVSGALLITRKVKSLTELFAEKLKGERVGVVAGSAHQRMLRDYFPDVTVVTFERQEWMLADLKAGGQDPAAFGDGMRLGFWLAGSDSADCCRFSGGPYLAPESVHSGCALAVSSTAPTSRRHSTMRWPKSTPTARLPNSICAISR